MSDKVYAKLVRGGVYVLGNKRFERNVPQEVSEQEAEHLKENAVDAYTSQDGSGRPVMEYKQKFEFVTQSDTQSDTQSGQSDAGDASTPKAGQSPRARPRG